jgi:membrane-bound inhibitor of C-type lysozyme
MKNFLINIMIFLFFGAAECQSYISGTVTNSRGEPLTGANIYLKNTYEGCTAGEEGQFTLETRLTGSQVLVVSFIGYINYEEEIRLDNSPLRFDVVLKESSNSIDAAVISAGFFEASDKKKSVLLRPLDIVTTANAEGDIYGAVNTLPGTQTVGETGRLFVRGGASHETKTFMDGMLVQSPYTSGLPDIPVRGRFSPFLFNGMIFSTGGYSAEYGQALSSALILNTNALPEEDVTGISLLSVGCGASHTKRWDNTSLTISSDYYNLTPYFRIINHSLDWIKEPESIGGTIMFRQKVGEEGLIKTFSSMSHSASSLYYPNYDTKSDNLIKLSDNNIYFNTTYNDMLNDRWMIKGGIACTYESEDLDVDSDGINDIHNVYQGRLALTNVVNDNLSFMFGGEMLYVSYRQLISSPTQDNNYDFGYNNNISSVFIETDIRAGSRIAGRFGARAEHSSLSGELTLAPRLSLACKTGKKSQVSIAWGMFYQSPRDEFLVYGYRPGSEKAVHYILNYQYSHEKRTFRIEAYYKDYDNLVKYEVSDSPDMHIYNSINNSGNGYAKGIDIFWRDSKTLKNADYWMSYSFIDTKRHYEDFPVPATPAFVSDHNLSLVFKYWISKLSSQLSMTYKYASGRPYYNPNNADFLGDRTKAYHNLSINGSYLTQLFGKFTIVHFSVNNLPGFDNIFGYEYSSEPGADSIFEAHPVKPYAKRTFILAVFISIT